MIQKLVMSCPHCHQKMKIQKKAAKYRCPHCSSICVVSSVNIFFLSIHNLMQTMIWKLKTKYQNIKNTYRYLKMVQENKKKH